MYLRSVLFTIVGLFLIFISPLQVAGFSIKEPQYRDGERWLFRVKSTEAKYAGDYQVTYQNGKFESDRLEFLSPMLVTIHASDPERKWFSFPLAPGTKWDYRYPHTSSVAGRFSWRHGQAEVIGNELQLIETAAGKFKAVEISREETSSRSSYPRITYFYSPECKCAAKLKGTLYEPSGSVAYTLELELIKHVSPNHQ